MAKFQKPIDEKGWVIHIKESFKVEEEETGMGVSIFNVPKALMASDPLSYVPQQIAIGPYHYWRVELYQMERYKVNAAKRFSKRLPDGLKFEEDVVGSIKQQCVRIRASYGKYLNLDDITLAWMLAMDACFLLEFLGVYASCPRPEVGLRMSHMVDVLGRKSGHNASLRDIVMLENQIPLSVLRKMLEWELSSQDLADEVLLAMLMGLYKDLSPFPVAEFIPRLDDCAHLLDFFYQLMVPAAAASLQVDNVLCCTSSSTGCVEQAAGDEDQTTSISAAAPAACDVDKSYLLNLVQQVWDKLLSLSGSTNITKRNARITRVVKVIEKLPWGTMATLPVVKEYLKRFFPATTTTITSVNNKKLDNGNDNDTTTTSATTLFASSLVEDINIPTVYELMKSGVEFLPTNGGGCGIPSIAFDSTTATLHLPVVRIDVNSQVLLRNMVAYESCITCGPLVFARYLEFMNGIIDSAEDSRALREKGILFNHLKSDAEVADLWNGMSMSIRLTKVPFLDKVIADVNNYYNCRWRVKAGRFIMSYVYGSWKIFTLLATLLLLLLSGLEAFCSVYSCPRFFHLDPTP
ncbi:unnamed protein product [Cuscuta epithymum]|uniref:Uncharacterized protein n=1 Tax=Cuscuta epithymum TaxID=186058 RepID=A0AAV0EZ84_9ASTE|nr:unnamed protein product [Cuscuta epithymum]